MTSWSKGSRRCAWLVLAAGVALLGYSLLQPLKAEVGSALLTRTFDARMAASPEARMTPDRWRPWPWAGFAPIAELHFPELGERRVVAGVATGEALAWSVGHMSETAALGAPGVSVVAGHRDGAFSLLGDLREGDVVELATVDGRILRYVIRDRRVVDSRTAQLPVDHEGPDELVLTTCWPIEALRSGPERLVIWASPVP